MRNCLSCLFAAGLILMLAAGFSACSHDDPTQADPCAQTSAGYLPCNETPEAVLHNLIVSYERREIEEYAQLLDPEFRFYFQDYDRGSVGTEFWTAWEDSIGTGALLGSPSVTNIVIDITYGEAIATTVARLPDPVMWIRVDPTKLIVDDVDDITYLVDGDIQDMFFRRGTGADSVRWFLYEWHDIRGGGGIGAPESGVLAGAAGVNSWGMLKTLY